MAKHDPLYENIQKHAKNITAGYHGELRVDREWEDIRLDKAHLLLHDFEGYNNQGFSHQIDTIFICPYFILVVEIKNIAGRIDLDEDKHQLIRTKKDGQQESFSNPIDQVERHVSFVQQLVRQRQITIPIIPAIISANPHAIIGKTPPQFLIFNVSGLRKKLQQLFEKYPTKMISTEQLNCITSSYFCLPISQ